MAEGHTRKSARAMMVRAGYQCGGHLGRAGGGVAGLMRSSGYAEGGDVKQDERMVRSGIKQHDDQLHGGKKTRLHFQEGGAAGSMARPRHDRSSRSHGDGKQPKINILIHSSPKPEGQGMGNMPPQSPPPPQAPPMPPHPPMGMPPGGAPGMLPMGAGPGGPLPPGGMPPRPPMPPMPGRPFKEGGNTRAKDGGRLRRQAGGTSAATPQSLGAAPASATAGIVNPNTPMPTQMPSLNNWISGQGAQMAASSPGANMGNSQLSGYLGQMSPMMQGSPYINYYRGMKQGGAMGSRGRGTHDMKYGAGSGAGRLEKIMKDVPDY